MNEGPAATCLLRASGRASDDARTNFMNLEKSDILIIFRCIFDRIGSQSHVNVLRSSMLLAFFPARAWPSVTCQVRPGCYTSIEVRPSLVGMVHSVGLLENGVQQLKSPASRDAQHNRACAVYHTLPTLQEAVASSGKAGGQQETSYQSRLLPFLKERCFRFSAIDLILSVDDENSQSGMLLPGNEEVCCHS